MPCSMERRDAQKATFYSGVRFWRERGKETDRRRDKRNDKRGMKIKEVQKG